MSGRVDRLDYLGPIEEEGPVWCSCGAYFEGGWLPWGMHVQFGACPEESPTGRGVWVLGGPEDL